MNALVEWDPSASWTGEMTMAWRLLRIPTTLDAVLRLSSSEPAAVHRYWTEFNPHNFFYLVDPCVGGNQEHGNLSPCLFDRAKEDANLVSEIKGPHWLQEQGERSFRSCGP